MHYFVNLHPIWRKRDMHYENCWRPSRLSLLAGFQDWESFKETVQGDLGGETIYGGHREMKDEKLKMKDEETKKETSQQ